VQTKIIIAEINLQQRRFWQEILPSVCLRGWSIVLSMAPCSVKPF